MRSAACYLKSWVERRKGTAAMGEASRGHFWKQESTVYINATNRCPFCDFALRPFSSWINFNYFTALLLSSPLLSAMSTIHHLLPFDRCTSKRRRECIRVINNTNTITISTTLDHITTSHIFSCFYRRILLCKPFLWLRRTELYCDSSQVPSKKEGGRTRYKKRVRYAGTNRKKYIFL